jgi:hypothetical protein
VLRDFWSYPGFSPITLSYFFISKTFPSIDKAEPYTLPLGMLPNCVMNGSFVHWFGIEPNTSNIPIEYANSVNPTFVVESQSSNACFSFRITGSSVALVNSLFFNACPHALEGLFVVIEASTI